MRCVGRLSSDLSSLSHAPDGSESEPATAPASTLHTTIELAEGEEEEL